jgi:hypothetical protein
MGRSLMTRTELDSLVSKGCFSAVACRPSGKETGSWIKIGWMCGFPWFLYSQTEINSVEKIHRDHAAYKVQIHQLTSNSIPQVHRFLWSCRTFGGANDVDTFVRHFDIHSSKRTLIVDGEEQEARYCCCTFQTWRINKNVVPVELAPAYKNK